VITAESSIALLNTTVTFLAPVCLADEIANAVSGAAFTVTFHDVDFLPYLA